MPCPPGTTRRKSHIRQGKRVSGSCVHTKGKNQTLSRKVQKTRKICPPGKIPRVSYIRHVRRTLRREGYSTHTKSGRTIRVHPTKKSVYVPSTCVKDTSRLRPGSAPRLGVGETAKAKIGPLRKGQLRKFGYSYKLPEPFRHSALLKAIAADGRTTIYHRLDAVAKLTVSTAPEASRIFAADRNWVRLQRQ